MGQTKQKKPQSKKQVNRQVKKQTESQVNKQVNQRKDNSTKYLCLFIVIVGFAFAFALLIDKQKNGYMNDIDESSFSVKPEVGKVIVARDMDAIYPKYFVVYTEGDSYSIYVYNYYETTSQYDLEYNRLIDKIVDYNAKDKMIRYIYDRGYGTYNEVLNNLSMIVNCENLRIY